MSFDSLLLNTCTVRQFTNAAADDYGVPGKTWSDFLADEPCRLVPNTNREVKIGAKVVIADYTLFIDNVGVTEQMRIIVDSVTYEVLSAMIRSDGIDTHHQECLLRVVR